MRIIIVINKKTRLKNQTGSECCIYTSTLELA